MLTDLTETFRSSRWWGDVCLVTLTGIRVRDHRRIENVGKYDFSFNDIRRILQRYQTLIDHEHSNYINIRLTKIRRIWIYSGASYHIIWEVSSVHSNLRRVINKSYLGAFLRHHDVILYVNLWISAWILNIFQFWHIRVCKICRAILVDGTYSDYYRLQTTDYRLQTTDYRLQTTVLHRTW